MGQAWLLCKYLVHSSLDVGVHGSKAVIFASFVQGQGLGKLLVHHMVQCLLQNDIQNIIIFCDLDGESPALMQPPHALCKLNTCCAFESLPSGLLLPALLIVQGADRGLGLQRCRFTGRRALTSPRVRLTPYHACAERAHNAAPQPVFGAAYVEDAVLADVPLGFADGIK